MMRRRITLLLLLMLLFQSLWAADFGFIVDSSGGYGDDGNGMAMDFSSSLLPRFSALFSRNGGLYISAGFKADYPSAVLESELPFFIVPELLRTELFWNFDSGNFRLGRMQYSDPLGFIADGLFDGIRLSLDSAAGIFSAGAWYTGFLYKKRANIAMTAGEMAYNSEDFDYNDFLNTYFATRRVVSAIGWEHPSLGDLMRLRIAVLGQFALPDEKLDRYVLPGAKSVALNSQYVAMKLTIPVKTLVFDLGGCFEINQNSADDEIGMSMAGEAGFSWAPTIGSQFSLLGRFSSGVTEGTGFQAFNPITTMPQGNLLKPAFSGLSMVSLDYIARLHQKISLSLAASTFVRSDLGTYSAYPAVGVDSDNYFLGTEFFGRVFWSPVSDIQVNLGGGAFLPLLGDVAPEAGMLWRVELNLILSLY